MAKNSNTIPIVPEAAKQERWKMTFQYVVVGCLSLFFLYITVTMYAQGEVLYGSILLVFTSVFSWVFLSNRAYVWRYVFPGLIGVFVFVIFPILYTLGLTFTNRSNVHLLEFDQAKSYFLQQTFITDGSKTYSISIYNEGEGIHIVLEDDDENLFMTDKPLPMTHTEMITESVSVILQEPDLEQAPRKAAIQYRTELSNLQLRLPSGDLLAKSKLREYGEKFPLWESLSEFEIKNLDDGTVLTADFEEGFFKDSSGEIYSPGFEVNIGLDNYKRLLFDKEMLEPFIRIFTWTIFFSVTTVIITFLIGMTLASFVQWEPIRGRGLYQLLLILPYAVPGFILIMIFNALFNQNFGQINHVLEVLFNFTPKWNSDPSVARLMILIVNIFMGYPYMFIISLGMLQSIPKDLYEASKLEGAGATVNFTRITLPLIIRPMLPLLIASFAFNFNNFTLIQLLTRGGPIIIGSNPQAGETDLLVNYAYRLAFMGNTRDFALAATVSTFIFVMVGVMMVAYLKVARIEVGNK